MSDSCTVPDICFFDDVEPVITCTKFVAFKIYAMSHFLLTL